MLDAKQRIHIITFWGVPNYGAFAQAYALNRVLAEQFPDFEVKHLAYLKKEHYDSYFTKKKPVLKIDGKVFSLNYYKSLLRYFKRWIFYPFQKEKRYSLFNQAWSLIPHIEVANEKELENTACDVLVTGSDCIWQFSTEMFGCDSHLMGENMKCNSLVGYACSCGDQQGPMPAFFNKMIKQFDGVSVRDSFSKKIVEAGFDYECDIPIVLDPTLVYDFKKDQNVIRKNRDSYILVYGSGFKKKTKKEIKRYARQSNVKILGVGKAPKWCDVIEEELNPFEWIGLFADAEFIVTDTFHGLMFCLVFNKKFYFYQQPYVKNRSEWILRELHLDQLFLNDSFSLKKMLDYEWDYESINQVINKYKEQSIEFLKNVLQGK